MKKYIFILLLLGVVFTAFNFVLAETEINFFYTRTCPHCAKEKKFLTEIEDKYPEIKINFLLLSEKKNIELLKNLYNDHQTPLEERGLIPVIFIGDGYFYGFSEEIGQNIEDCIIGLIENNSQKPCQPENSEKVSLPFIGDINITKFSPLVLAMILGGLDGFNACAMVALGFLLAVLVATGIRKRVFLIGGTFILVSGLVYFLFISAWLNLFLILERIKFITYLVGAVIVLFSVFLLRDYFKGVICKLCQTQTNKESIFTKLERKLFIKMEKFSTAEMSLPLILLGVAVVAAGVNLVEIVCSFGFPLAFTKILTNLNLPTLHYYFYLIIYIIFYMLDDFLIFLVAVLTLRITQISEKYLKVIKLVSGIFLLLLGLLMIFYPEILMFN